MNPNQTNSLTLPLSGMSPGIEQLVLCRIKCGQCLMGSPVSEAGRSESETQFLSRVSHDFWIAKCPATQAQWQVVMGNNPSAFQDSSADCPVENVSWYDAIGFTTKLNILYASLIPSGYHFSLPTEAQWEFACRAGTTSKYFFGEADEDLDRFAWHRGNSGGRTHPVGRKASNPWGVHDQYGNVYEWCWDGLGDYPRIEGIDWIGPDNHELRICRGGGYSASVAGGSFRSACRNYIDPQIKRPWFGFRLCLRRT